MKPENKNPIHELISAISALNTYPNQKELEELKSDVYISEQFEMVAHSIEHITSAITLLVKDLRNL